MNSVGQKKLYKSIRQGIIFAVEVEQGNVSFFFYFAIALCMPN